MSIKAAYVSYCTEYEAGWGCKPDGFIASKNKESLNRKIKEINSDRGNGYFVRAETRIELEELSEEQYNRLTDDNVVWF